MSTAATQFRPQNNAERKLLIAALKGNGRVERARAYVREQVKKLKLASIEAI